MTEDVTRGYDLSKPANIVCGVTEILPRLWIGGLTDAREFDGTRICVRCEGADYEKRETDFQFNVLIPPPAGFLEPYCFSRQALYDAAICVKQRLYRNEKVLVHCLFGRDRAPMVVAFYLCIMGLAKNLDAAYELLRARRPIVADRQSWLEPLDASIAALAGTGEAGWIGFPPIVKVEKSEQAKYVEMWSHEEYRKYAPGEEAAATFIDIARPKRGASVLDFGAGTGRGAVMLAMLGALNVKMLDFASNCLDDFVRDALKTQPLLSFAECNLIKSIPHTAEYGYCTDVMEHIPPEWVTTVFINILKAAKHVFFQISLTEDGCGKLIGETLHLSVHPAKWWMERLEKIGAKIFWWQEIGSDLRVYCSAWVDGEEIVKAGIGNVTDEEIRKNAEANLSGPWIDIGPHEPNTAELAVLGGGPSLEGQLDDIRRLKASGVKLVTLNGAYNWAHEKGLFPVNQFVVDAREFNARFTKPVDERNQYFIASQCNPKVLEGLPVNRTYLWHGAKEPIKDLLDKYRPDAWVHVQGGSTILLRALPLMIMMGFRKFHLFGCDSCLEGDYILKGPKHHAYPQPENDNAPVSPVIVGGRTYYCHPWMIAQAQEFITLIKIYRDMMELEIHGDGLLKGILLAGADAADEAIMTFA